MYRLFRKICYWIFCVVVFVPFAVMLFITGGIDAVSGFELHEKFTGFAGGIVDKVHYDR
jgi:hypothetical protein